MANTRLYKRNTPEPVDRKAALAREEGFIERVTANVTATPAIFNPADGKFYDASLRNRVMRTLDDRSQDVKVLIRKFADRDLMKTYEEMPKNPGLVFEIWHQQMFSNRQLKVAVAAAAVSPIEELIRKGSSAQAARPEDVRRVVELVATQENVFYYIGAFSTTGWTEPCRQLLVGANHLAALCDVAHGAWRTYFAPDPRWRSTMRVFDLASDEEKIEAIRQFARKQTFALLMDELTEDYVYEELGYPIPVIREAFEVIASEDRFVRLETGEVPYRLIRVYG